MVFIEEVGRIFSSPSCIVSCRALSADSLKNDAAQRQLQLNFLMAVALAYDEAIVPVAVFLDCFCCLAMFCDVRVTKPAQANKNTKSQTTRCTKPAGAPNKQTTKSRNCGFTSSSCLIFCVLFFFVFVGVCRCLVQPVCQFFVYVP